MKQRRGGESTRSTTHAAYCAAQFCFVAVTEMKRDKRDERKHDLPGGLTYPYHPYLTFVSPAAGSTLRELSRTRGSGIVSDESIADSLTVHEYDIVHR